MYYFDYQHCLTAPVVPSAVMGTVFAGLDVAQGGTFTPSRIFIYAGGLYAYNVIQCPMEAIHGRQSLAHNMLAGGILGYVGVSSGHLGVPFVSPMALYRYPWMPPSAAAFLVYGGLAGTFAALGGKRL